MNSENVESNSDQQRQILSDLQHLLEKQIDLAHQGDIADVECIIEQANILVGEIAQMRILEWAQFRSQRTRLQKLYEALSLALTAQKADIAENLSHLRKGRKTIKAYRSNT
jgi:hypothetical protein